MIESNLRELHDAAQTLKRVATTLHAKAHACLSAQELGTLDAETMDLVDGLGIEVKHAHNELKDILAATTAINPPEPPE